MEPEQNQEEYIDEIFERGSEASEIAEKSFSCTSSESSDEEKDIQAEYFRMPKAMDEVIDTTATNFKEERIQIVSKMVGLAGVISSIIDYSAKTLLLEVSKIARDQMLNENIKPDYGAFRVQLFKYLWKHSHLAERKTKILSPILIDLYREEFQKADSQFSRFQDLFPKIKNLKNQEVSKDSEAQPTAPTTSAVKWKDVILALKALLAVFAKFSSPKTVFREPEIRQIYNEMLLSSDPELQRLALSCLSSYKDNFLLPYVEHLDNLLNEKKLRDELVLFTVDDQNCVVSEEHRIQLMPIVMRILYGRFHTHVAVRGKTRRMAIFAFLASCNTDEMDVFFQLVFTTFENMLVRHEDRSLDLVATLTSLSEAYDPRKTLPLNKIKSTLGILDDILKRMAFSLDDSQISLSFAVCLISGVLVNKGLNTVGSIDGHAASMLKSLRKKSFNTLIRLFQSFQSRDLSSEKLCCVFDLLLEPIIASLCGKIICILASNSRYFSLLQRKFDGQLSGQTPISLLCNSLSSAGTPVATQSSIIRGVLNMLVSEDINNEKESSEGVNSGTRILLPYVVSILQYVAEKIPSNAKSTLNIPSAYLEILNKLSTFIDDAHLGGLFTTTLLSYLGNRQFLKKKEKLVNVLITVAGLSSYVQEPLQQLKKISRLLSMLDDRDTRSALIQFISSLKTNSRLPSAMVTHIQLLEELETWDPKRIEEPDAQRRHQAFDILQQMYESTEVVIGLETLQLFVHSHAYCILHLSSISLKKSASDALRQMVSYLQASSLKWEIKRSFLQDHLIPLLLKGVNSQNEICRMEFLQCLGSLISAFPQVPDFAALSSINCVHRRQRALFRLTELLNEEELDISYEVLLKFVWPTFKPYMLVTDSKLSALSDQSLKLFSSVLRRTPWKRYCAILDQHLPKINDEEHTKGAIRVVSAILDSFHFNLSECKIPVVKLVESEDVADPTHEEPIDDRTEGGLAEIDQAKSEEEILVVVVRKLLPKLRQYSRPNHESHSHKKAQSSVYSNDEEQLVRAPLLLSTVKLLKNLPKWAIDQNLHSLLASMSQLLLSRSIGVRQDARKIMGQVVEVLGPSYLPFIIKEMKQTMNKGYQVHIMIFTVHTIIAVLEDKMVCGDVDACLQDIFEICKWSYSVNIPEAKSNKVLETYTYMGRFVSSEHLNDVLCSMDQIIEERPQAGTMKKLSGLLRGFSIGVNNNSSLGVQQLLSYILDILNKHLDQVLTHQTNSTSKEAQRKAKSKRPPNCLLLAPEPKEYALQLFCDVLKNRCSTVKDGEDVLALLNSFVPLLTNALKLKYERIIALSLRSLVGLIKYPLEHFSAQIQAIVDRLFVVLSEYAGMGNNPGLVELSQLLFKVFCNHLKTSSSLTLTSKKIQILLNYAETDILDSHKQATAFDLVKAIIGKKVVDEKVDNVVDYLSEIVITSHSANVREQCQKTILLYLTSHPTGRNTIEKRLEFF
uniref:Small subunit processome component 20 homolog n=1 Tax=Ditylenchus dipsaci TaxID=166011 RepID=A0A915DUY4_9BILA